MQGCATISFFGGPQVHTEGGGRLARAHLPPPCLCALADYLLGKAVADVQEDALNLLAHHLSVRTRPCPDRVGHRPGHGNRSPPVQVWLGAAGAFLAQTTTPRSPPGAQRTAPPLAARSNGASVGETGLEPATPGPPDQCLFLIAARVRPRVVSSGNGWKEFHTPQDEYSLNRMESVAPA
jgi:hypothetical protein